MKKGNKRFKKFVADDYEARKSERKAQKEKGKSQRKRSNEIIREMKRGNVDFDDYEEYYG